MPVGVPEIVATLLLKLIDTPVGSPVAEALNVSEQVVVNVRTTSVIAVEIVTVCDCGPDVSVKDIVQEDAVVELPVAAAITLISPVYEAEAVPVELTALTV